MLPFPKPGEWGRGADKLAYQHAGGKVTQKQSHEAAQESEQIKEGLINQDARVFPSTPSQMPPGFSLTP